MAGVSAALTGTRTILHADMGALSGLRPAAQLSLPD
jgi:hypothetical protein